ncbi:MAG: hypothetical protein JXX14_00975 [Deltaproteobacteria bacterium]|nr:hypothetical protein [Deltaproteobacteria bacterium]
MMMRTISLFGLVNLLLLPVAGCSVGTGDGTLSEDDGDTHDDQSTDASPASTDSDSDEPSDSGDPLPMVPRPFEDGGYSFLDNGSNADWGYEGVCPALEVYCNGACLSAPGDESDNCTLMVSKLDELDAIHLNSQYVVYLAALREVLKTDLATFETTGVLSGISFPRAIALSETTVWAGSGFPGFEGVVSAALDGSNPTIVMDNDDDLYFMDVGGGKLFFQSSGFSQTLYAIPDTGGVPAPAFGENYSFDGFQVFGDRLYYGTYTNQGRALMRVPLSTTDIIADQEPLAYATYLEEFCISESHVYLRVRESSSEPYSVLVVDQSTLDATLSEIAGLDSIIACNDSYAVYRMKGEDTDDTSEIMLHSATDSILSVLGTIEKDGFAGAVANDTHVYVGVGEGATSGIVRFTLP